MPVSRHAKSLGVRWPTPTSASTATHQQRLCDKCITQLQSKCAPTHACFSVKEDSQGYWLQLLLHIVQSKLDQRKLRNSLHHAAVYTVNILQRVQNRFAKIVACSPLLQSLRWLATSKRIEHNVWSLLHSEYGQCSFALAAAFVRRYLDPACVRHLHRYCSSRVQRLNWKNDSSTRRRHWFGTDWDFATVPRGTIMLCVSPRSKFSIVCIILAKLNHPWPQYSSSAAARRFNGEEKLL
jgi:hypothetical protein